MKTSELVMRVLTLPSRVLDAAAKKVEQFERDIEVDNSWRFSDAGFPLNLVYYMGVPVLSNTLSRLAHPLQRGYKRHPCGSSYWN